MFAQPKREVLKPPQGEELLPNRSKEGTGKTHAEGGKENAQPKEGKEGAQSKAGKEVAQSKEGKGNAQHKGGKDSAQPKKEKLNAQPKAGKENAQLKGGKENAQSKGGKENVPPGEDGQQDLARPDSSQKNKKKPKKKVKGKENPLTTGPNPTTNYEDPQAGEGAETKSGPKPSRRRKEKAGGGQDPKGRRNGKKLTPYQGKWRGFGLYYCSKCTWEWRSAYSWANMGQGCTNCLTYVYPYRQVHYSLEFTT
ncbi:unnamed protein product [Darwinula stevensoni]|uniref:Zinc finger domain-containing protein n=1 Tax=Darwinula stevensoni TaxID=69355 RepID=A0A7R9ADQ4_9CRUS|nr:unnamed protein product [Darwinula stevensoni]CAG0901523.1 unnamed protein product [Darwinula stevensoni]